MYQIGFEDLKASIEEAKAVCKFDLAIRGLVVLHHVLKKAPLFEIWIRFSRKTNI